MAEKKLTANAVDVATRGMQCNVFDVILLGWAVY